MQLSRRSSKRSSKKVVEFSSLIYTRAGRVRQLPRPLRARARHSLALPRALPRALRTHCAHTLPSSLCKKKKSSALNGVVKLMCAGDPEALALILRELIMETRDIVALLQLPPLQTMSSRPRSLYCRPGTAPSPPAQPSPPSRIRLPSATRCTANASMAKIHRDGVSGAAPRQQLWRLVQRRGRQRCWKRHQQQPPPRRRSDHGPVPAAAGKVHRRRGGDRSTTVRG